MFCHEKSFYEQAFNGQDQKTQGSQQLCLKNAQGVK